MNSKDCLLSPLIQILKFSKDRIPSSFSFPHCNCVIKRPCDDSASRGVKGQRDDFSQMSLEREWTSSRIPMEKHSLQMHSLLVDKKMLEKAKLYR